MGALIGCHGVPMFHAMGSSAIIMAVRLRAVDKKDSGANANNLSARSR